MVPTWESLQIDLATGQFSILLFLKQQHQDGIGSDRKHFYIGNHRAWELVIYNG